MKTKTIILSNPNDPTNNSGRGILSFHLENDLLICKLRLYNLPKLNKFSKLGVYHQQEVSSANLLEKNGCYETSLVGNFDMDKDFYCAIIDTDKNNSIIIAGGTYSGYYFENSFFSQEESIDTQSVSPCRDSDTKTEQCANCEHCKYKDFFYNSQLSDQEQIKEDPQVVSQDTVGSETLIETAIPSNILESLLPQFDYIFEKYPQNKELQTLIENSRFVQIEENGEKFSLGAIYSEDEMKYICYAVKSNYNLSAPSELGNHYQWVPLDKDDPLSDGYYLVFQDVVDLKIVEL